MNTSLSPLTQATAMAAVMNANEKSLDQWHVLLWSQSQCALHIEPFSTMMQSNRRAYTEDRRMDYVPIFIGHRENCDTIAASVRGTLHIRQDARPARELI